jgi:hypothetical protein
VGIEGKERTEKFGAVLSDAEKKWFVESINDFLRGVHGSPYAQPPVKAEPLPVGAVSPHQLSAGSHVTLLDAPAGELRFRLAGFPRGRTRTVLGLGALLFAAGWIYGFLWNAFSDLGNQPDLGDWLGAGVMVLMAACGLMPLFFAMYAFWGKLTVHLTPKALSCRSQVGPLRFGKTVPPFSVKRVVIRKAIEVKSGDVDETAIRNNKVCFVEGPGFKMPLTSNHDLQTAREVAGLMTAKLRDMGFDPVSEELFEADYPDDQRGDDVAG